MKQMWPFGHMGDLLLLDSAAQSAAAHAGAAHRKALTQHMLLPCGRSESMQRQRSQVRLSSSRGVTDPTEEQSSANPGEALKSRTFTLFLQVENEFHFCEKERSIHQLASHQVGLHNKQNVLEAHEELNKKNSSNCLTLSSVACCDL